METVYRLVEYKGMKVRNVPHLYKGGKLFADGEDVMLSGRTAATLLNIYQLMINMELEEVEYSDIYGILWGGQNE